MPNSSGWYSLCFIVYAVRKFSLLHTMQRGKRWSISQLPQHKNVFPDKLVHYIVYLLSNCWVFSFSTGASLWTKASGGEKNNIPEHLKYHIIGEQNIKLLNPWLVCQVKYHKIYVLRKNCKSIILMYLECSKLHYGCDHTYTVSINFPTHFATKSSLCELANAVSDVH